VAYCCYTHTVQILDSTGFEVATTAKRLRGVDNESEANEYIMYELIELLGTDYVVTVDGAARMAALAGLAVMYSVRELDY